MGFQLDDIRNIEPARQFLFDLELNMNAISNLKDLTFRAKSSAIPENTTESIEINYKYDKASHGGRDASAKTWQCIFWEDMSLTVYKALKQWKNLQYNPRTGRGFPKFVYAGTANLVMLDGNESKIAQFNLQGVYPESISEVPLDYASSEAVEITVTFRYDYFEVI